MWPILITNKYRKVGIRKAKILWDNKDIYNSGVHVVSDLGVGYPILEEYSSVNMNLISGDSGHPTFAYLNGELVLISTHTTSFGGPNYSSYVIQEKIKNIIETMLVP